MTGAGHTQDQREHTVILGSKEEEKYTHTQNKTKQKHRRTQTHNETLWSWVKAHRRPYGQCCWKNTNSQSWCNLNTMKPPCVIAQRMSGCPRGPTINECSQTWTRGGKRQILHVNGFQGIYVNSCLQGGTPELPQLLTLTFLQWVQHEKGQRNSFT